jgi:hypothetical protein
VRKAGLWRFYQRSRSEKASQLFVESVSKAGSKALFRLIAEG